ncbi:MAG: hypothetical protein Solumvirus4_13 [Solumvirus sp.]|uniref:Uncharacterized protein n=1 Tax=Solumvirus sp. TaxID=2487773 RepID=A0A3G5AGH6_9VIRU|nr:MAG: hypothetical protein Solumvirus4_13 [Solumvirus sp.]
MSQKKDEKSTVISNIKNDNQSTITKTTIKIGNKTVSGILIEKDNCVDKKIITGIVVYYSIFDDVVYEYHIDGNSEGPTMYFEKDGTISYFTKFNTFYFSGDGSDIDKYYEKFRKMRKIIYKYITIPQLVEEILIYSYYGPEYIEFLRIIQPIIVKVKHCGYMVDKMISIMQGNYKDL